jgi:hypothetical protein
MRLGPKRPRYCPSMIFGNEKPLADGLIALLPIVISGEVTTDPPETGTRS